MVNSSGYFSFAYPFPDSLIINSGGSMKALIFCLLFVPFFILFNGCEKFLTSNQYESSSSESKVISLAGQTDFTVENTNGNIVISASDTAKNIYCNITKEVKSSISDNDAQAHLKDIIINTSKTGTGVKMSVNQPSNNDRTYIIKFGIIMPDNFNYNLELGNGNVTINSSTKNLAVNIGNGNADAGIVPKDECNVSMSIGNGSIDLKIPGSTNAAVNAKVGNGSISSEGLNFQEQKASSRNLSGKLGSGTGSIELSVGNGSISISKK